MAKDNGNSAPPGARTTNPLNWDYRYFASDQYEYGSSPHMATVALEGSFNAATAIRAISQILMADDVEQQNGDDGLPLTRRLRADLLLGIHQLSAQVVRELEQTEIRLFSDIKKEDREAKRG